MDHYLRFRAQCADVVRTTPVITHRSMSAQRHGPRIAVVGVSSLIGEAVIDELRARKMPFAELHALDDERNVGRRGSPKRTETQATGERRRRL